MTIAAHDHNHLQGTLKDLLSASFRGVEIVSVAVAEGSDDDDSDDAVEITIVFRGTTDQLVRGRPERLFEMVRNCLRAVQPRAFPVLNFIAA